MMTIWRVISQKILQINSWNLVCVLALWPSLISHINGLHCLLFKIWLDLPIIIIYYLYFIIRLADVGLLLLSLFYNLLTDVGLLLSLFYNWLADIGLLLLSLFYNWLTDVGCYCYLYFITGCLTLGCYCCHYFITGWLTWVAAVTASADTQH